MAKFVFETDLVRRVPDPVFGPSTQRYIFILPVDRIPTGLPREPNPRAADIDRSVWKDIEQHLLNDEGTPNTFHLKNKGITVLASAVEKLDERRYSVVFDEGDGIVDGGHTYQLITERLDEILRRNADNPDKPINQFVKFEVLTGIPEELATEIAGGLNTAVQVQSYSLENLKGHFDWIKTEIAGKPYADDVIFRENETGRFDVRDVLVILDLFNITEFPNDGQGCPSRAYSSKSAVLDNYVAHPEQYTMLRPILNQALELHDRISHEACKKHNEAGGKGENLSFVETKDKNKPGTYYFPFAQREGKNRLHRAALLPMLGAFRWMVTKNAKGLAEWDGGYDQVLAMWDRVAAELMRATHSACGKKDNQVHIIGRSKPHWENLHNIVAKRHLMQAREQK